MEIRKVNIKKLSEDAKIPTYGTDYAAGADLYACSSEKISFIILNQVSSSPLDVRNVK